MIPRNDTDAGKRKYNNDKKETDMQITLKILVGLIALLMAFMGLNAMFNATAAAQQFGVTPEGIVGLSTS